MPTLKPQTYHGPGRSAAGPADQPAEVRIANLQGRLREAQEEIEHLHGLLDKYTEKVKVVDPAAVAGEPALDPRGESDDAPDFVLRDADD